MPAPGSIKCVRGEFLAGMELYFYCSVVIYCMELNDYCVVVVQYPIIPLRNVIVKDIILNLLNASERSF